MPDPRNQRAQQEMDRGPVRETRSLIELQDENARLRKMIDRLMDQAVERWHESSSGAGSEDLARWLGLTSEQYAGWVERDDEKFLTAAAPDWQHSDEERIGEAGEQHCPQFGAHAAHLWERAWCPGVKALAANPSEDEA